MLVIITVTIIALWDTASDNITATAIVKVKLVVEAIKMNSYSKNSLFR